MLTLQKRLAGDDAFFAHGSYGERLALFVSSQVFVLTAETQVCANMPGED